MRTALRHDSFTSDERLTQALLGPSLSIQCDEGRILFSQGETPKGIYLLKSGEAALMMQAASGQIVLCQRALPGSILGLPAVIGNVPYTMSALVRKDSSLGFVS